MFKMQFETANEAFDEVTYDEVARILRSVANHVADEGGTIMDINGYTIGSWVLS